ncbi:hypothetical protein D3C78_1690260 [compost metagenome]
MPLDFVPVMHAVQIGLLLISVQLIAAVICWRTGNVGQLVVSSSITAGGFAAILAAILVRALNLPFPAIPVALLMGANVGFANAFFAHKALQRYAQVRSEPIV